MVVFDFKPFGEGLRTGGLVVHSPPESAFTFPLHGAGRENVIYDETVNGALPQSWDALAEDDRAAFTFSLEGAVVEYAPVSHTVRGFSGGEAKSFAVTLPLNVYMERIIVQFENIVTENTHILSMTTTETSCDAGSYNFPMPFVGTYEFSYDVVTLARPGTSTRVVTWAAEAQGTPAPYSMSFVTRISSALGKNGFEPCEFHLSPARAARVN